MLQYLDCISSPPPPFAEQPAYIATIPRSNGASCDTTFFSKNYDLMAVGRALVQADQSVAPGGQKLVIAEAVCVCVWLRVSG